MPVRGRYIGPNGESYNPTLRAPRTNNVEEDCKALHAAMKGLGTDEETIIEILGHRTLAQRLDIKNQYKTMFGQDLKDRLGGELNSNFKQVAQMLVYDWPTLNAKALKNAISGGGTKESVIVEILCTTNNDEMELLKEEYEKITSRTLEKDLKGDLSGHFERLCIALLQGGRDELTEDQVEKMREDGVKTVLDINKVNQDVEDLYDAGDGRLGTDESTLIRIITTRNVWHLKAVDLLYQQKFEKTLTEAIDSETSGDFRDALKLALSTCLSPIKTYSELLRGAMQGAGTTDFTLMRIIVTRCEVDLKDIATQFAMDQGQPLEDWVRDDTSGDYRRLLVALLGGNWRE